MIAALAGGIGAARFLEGLTRVVPEKELFIVGNTGDDAEIHGLHISPDLDTVVYTLAGLAHRSQGWGLAGDSFRCLAALRHLGAETWFQLGDLDLATHIYRTERLRAGAKLSAVTRQIAAALGLRAAVAPMSDDRVRTVVETRSGPMEFQTYFVRRRAKPVVLGVRFEGAASARPAPGVLDALRKAHGVVFCPSNPIISIGPILAVPGVRRALERTKAPVIAISPIVAGRALKGPAARMLRSLGMKVSALGVAELYRGLVDIFVLDHADRELAGRIEKLGMNTVVTHTIMAGTAEKKALARAVVQALERA